MTDFYYFFLVKKKKNWDILKMPIYHIHYFGYSLLLLLMAKPTWVQKNASSQFSFCITVILSSSCGGGQSIFQVITDGSTDVESCFEMGN